MIEIINQRVFINGKETVDPVLIGYAILDLAENTTESIYLTTKEFSKEKFIDFVSEN